MPNMHNKPVTTSRKLIHNTLFNVITLFATALIGFLLIRFFLSKLGESQYGIWIIVGSIFRYRGMLSLGLNSSINRLVPVYLAQEDSNGIKKTISTSLFFLIILSVFLFIISIVISINIERWFAIEAEFIKSAKITILIIGLSFAVSMPLQLYSAVLSGLQRYDIINFARLIPILIRTILLVIFLSSGFGLVAMGIIFGVSEIVVRLVQFLYVKKLLPNTKVSTKNIDLKLLNQMLIYGANTFLYSMGALIIYKSSDIIIGVFLSTSEVTRFYIAIAAIMLLAQFLQAFNAAIKPAVSDLDTRNDHEKLLKITFLSQKYSLLLIVPAVLFLVFMGKEFLTVWVGEKFASPETIQQLGFILAILAVGHGLRLAQHSNFVVLVGKGDHKIFGIMTALMAFLCIVLSVASIKFLGARLVGVAWSIFTPMTLISGLFLPIYFNIKMKIKFKDTFTNTFWPAAKGVVIPTLVLMGWKYFAPPNSWAMILAVVLSTAAATIVGSWFFSIEDVERKRFVNLLSNRIRIKTNCHGA